MNRIIILALVFGLAAAVFQGCGDDGVKPTLDTTTVTFQDGVSPWPTWNGTSDAVLKDGPSDMQEFNTGNLPSDTLGTVQLGNALHERRLLVRFDLTDISSCAEVYRARLTVKIVPSDTSIITFNAMEAAVPPAVAGTWIEGSGDQGVDWLTVDGSNAWGRPGGDVAGFMDDRTVAGDSSLVFDLPVDRVLTWIRDPSQNHGVLIIPDDASAEGHVTVHMRENEDRRLRPELEIRFRKAG